MEYPIFSFSYFFFVAAILKMLQKTECITNFPVIITDSYSIGCKLAEKYKFVNLKEGCMMGLPRLQPTRLCMHAGPRNISFWVVSKRFPDKVLTHITTPATQFGYQMKTLD